MKSRAGIMVLSGLVVAVLVWVFAFRSASWAAPITEPLFIPGTLLVLALTPARNHAPDLSVIILGYTVDFIFTWALMTSVVGLVMRLISKRRVSART
jgi:uncharacterized membrane protein